MRLCLIEDEQPIAQTLKRVLEKNGFAVDCAADGEVGLFYASHNHYDCIILDLNLPKLSGLELIAQLRQAQNQTPVIMLTARSQVYNKLEGFTAGADDYITKPFHLDELIARVRAVIKRSSANQADHLQFGNHTFYPEQNLVDHITLTTKESAILEYLLRHPDRIISTEELLEHVWDQEVNLFTDTVKTHIKTLRQKIDPTKKLIATVRGRGYKITV